MAKKKGLNSKKKGASYERTIAKLLSTWWGAEFHKTPASGALRWGVDNRVVGDIVAPTDAEKFPFVVECKKREQWNFLQIIKGTGEFISYWEQVNEDVLRLEDKDMQPLVVMAKNHQPNLYVIRKEVHDKLGLPNKNCFNTIIEFELRGEKKEEEISIGLFSDLLNVPKEKVLEELVSE